MLSAGQQKVFCTIYVPQLKIQEQQQQQQQQIKPKKNGQSDQCWLAQVVLGNGKASFEAIFCLAPTALKCFVWASKPIMDIDSLKKKKKR